MKVEQKAIKYVIKSRRTLEIAETCPAPVFCKTGSYSVLGKAERPVKRDRHCA